eukprot:1196316-Prorocentrum_minimum.AAC.6
MKKGREAFHLTLQEVKEYGREALRELIHQPRGGGAPKTLKSVVLNPHQRSRETLTLTISGRGRHQPITPIIAAQ